MTLPTAEDAGTAEHSDRVIACLADGRHLFIVYGGLLDNDIQPANEDFSVKIKGKNAHIKAAQLRSPLQAGSAWSVITLLADRALPTTTEVTVSYHPIQWLLCSQGQEEPVDPFELSTRLLDGAALAAQATPGTGGDAVQEGNKVVSGAKASITAASGRRVSIKLERELDIYQKLDAADFRAELNDRWLTVTKAYFQETAAAAAEHRAELQVELQVELRETLEGGEQIKVSFKSPKKQLKTSDGTAIVSFTATGTTSSDSTALQAAPAAPTAINHHGLATLGRLYPDLSDTDQGLARLIGFVPDEQSPQGRDPQNPGTANTVAKTPVAEDPVGQDPHEPPSPQQAPPLAAGPLSQHPQPLHPESPALPDPQPAQATNPLPPVVDTGAGPAAAATPIPDDEAQTDTTPGSTGGGKRFAWLGAAAVVVAAVYLGSLLLDDGGEPAAAAGQCTVDYADGGHYQGQCVDGKREGQGHYVWASGVDYRGGWSGDTMHGEGVMQLKNGARIEGKWQGGNSVGLTNITWPNGTHYIGQVDNTQPNGIGRITYANGDTYKGEFENSLMHGSGTMTWASGAKYSGEYQQGKASGQGIYWSTDGSRFEGQFAEGKPTRKGTCYRSDGSSKLGRCTR